MDAVLELVRGKLTTDECATGIEAATVAEVGLQRIDSRLAMFCLRLPLTLPKRT